MNTSIGVWHMWVNEKYFQRSLSWTFIIHVHVWESMKIETPIGPIHNIPLLASGIFPGFHSQLGGTLCVSTWICSFAYLCYFAICKLKIGWIFLKSWIFKLRNRQPIRRTDICAVHPKNLSVPLSSWCHQQHPICIAPKWFTIGSVQRLSGQSKIETRATITTTSLS